MTPSNSPIPDTPNARAVERQVAALLTRYAEEMPATVDTEARARLATPVRARAAGHARTRWLPSRVGAPHSAGGWARGSVSLGLVAALIIGFVAVSLTRHGVASVRPGVTTAPCGETDTNPCPASDIKASVAVTRSYADPTRTVVELQIVTPGARIPHGASSVTSPPDRLDLFNVRVRDAQGHIYWPTNTLPGSVFAYSAGQDVAIGYYEFDPLPESMLDAPQTLTLDIGLIMLESARSQDTASFAGLWSAAFKVAPHAGRSVDLRVAPQTHHGITIQPLRLDIGPNASVFDGLGGGERLILRVSGLAPDTVPNNVTGFSTAVSLPDGGSLTSGGRLRATLLLEGQPPATVAGANNRSPAVVGPSGTMDLEVIFLSPPLSHLTGTQTLSLDQIIVSSDERVPNVQGPWVFAIPLS